VPPPVPEAALDDGTGTCLDASSAAPSAAAGSGVLHAPILAAPAGPAGRFAAADDAHDEGD